MTVRENPWRGNLKERTAYSLIAKMATQKMMTEIESRSFIVEQCIIGKAIMEETSKTFVKSKESCPDFQ